MAREVRWARRALDALDSAVAYLGERDPHAAERLVEEINRVVGELSRRNTGRPGRVKGTFERSIPKWRYIIVFEIVARPRPERRW